MSLLAFQSLANGRARRAGRSSSLWNMQSRRHQSIQTRNIVFTIALKAAALLGFDDDDAVAGNAAVAARKKTGLDRLGQRRRAHVEAQVHRVGDLVDVLPAGALRAHRGDLDLALR